MKTPTGVAPVILSLYPQLDAGQLELISSLDGPTLGVAGSRRRQDPDAGAPGSQHPIAGIGHTGGAAAVHLQRGRGR